ncbi:response regulator [Spirosoma validum]|uniref:Response regulator n=1 Tax=Spirosoma validum TaxID=2771355 RepID=A0A927B994_9BACT|nr:response regulator [Spirosoma validum]MBD2757482.1 response regulator [Spirosoma validum]
MNDFKKKWVILVDDDEDDRFLFQQAFRPYSSNYLLQTLATGPELFQLLEDSLGLPALIILDLNMPLVDGFEVLTWLRSHADYALIPTVILTTSADQTDRQRAQELGANRFLTKPPTLPDLTKLVAGLEQDWLVRL